MANIPMGKNPKKGPNGLTQIQTRFCEEYVKDFSHVDAYLRASPTCTDRNSASAVARKILAKPEARAEIERIQKSLYEAQFVNYERIAGELAQIGFHSESEKNRLAALSQLSKMMGLEKTVVNADINQTIDIKVDIDDAD